jgi:hypothetical protein
MATMTKPRSDRGGKGMPAGCRAYNVGFGPWDGVDNHELVDVDLGLTMEDATKLKGELDAVLERWKARVVDLADFQD